MLSASWMHFTDQTGSIDGQICTPDTGQVCNHLHTAVRRFDSQMGDANGGDWPFACISYRVPTAGTVPFRMQFIVLFVIFVLMMAGLMRPYIGLLALLIVMELQPGELYPSLAPMHLERIAALLLLISFLIHGEKWRFPAPTRWFLAFYGAMVMSVPLALWRSNTIASCISFLEVVGYVLFATALLTTEKRIRGFLLTEILLVAWLGGGALYNYSRGIWWVRMNIERAVGITSSAGDPDTLGATLLFSIPLCIALASRGNPRWMRIAAFAVIGMALLTIVDTGSRGAALGVVFLTGVLILRKRRNLIFLPLVIALSPVVWFAIPPQYKARYETVDHLSKDDSYQVRILSWRGGIAMFEHNPVTGVGAGNYTYANGMGYWPGPSHHYYLNAHSLYFKLLGELGLVGIFTFGGYVICVFRLNMASRKRLLSMQESRFLTELPALLNIILLQLLFAGYAAHNLYRINWFVIGAVSASISLLPALQQAATGSEPNAAVAATDSKGTLTRWSPALLPALRARLGSGPGTI
jgi:probable O-glycosylation ligase (exosortase A-associated)